MSVAWVTIAVSDLDHYLVAAQTEALRSAALSDGQSDPFTEIMPRVVARVRAMIEACQTNVLSATALSVPPSLKDYTCFLILEEMSLRIPMLQFTEQQSKMADTARNYLKEISKCNAKVEVPLNPLQPPSTQSNSNVEVVSRSERVTSREKLGGL